MPTSLPVHTLATAPATARPALEGVQRSLGFVPNLFATLAGAPPALDAYLAIDAAYAKTSLSPTERQLVLLATSVENACHYCVAAHTVVAGMSKVPADVIDALRAGQPLADTRLEALRRFTIAVVSRRGWVADEDVASFLAAGYTREQLLEVLIGVTLKTFSNYLNHIAATPLDAAFAAARWEPATKAPAA